MMKRFMTGIIETVIAAEKILIEARESYEAEKKRQEENSIRR